MADAGRRVPIIAQVTVETTGTMLLGSEIGAALTALEPLGIDLIGLNCATGPAEMSEHLRHLSRHARVPLSLHAQRRPARARPRRRALPAHPGRAGRRAGAFVREYGLGWSAAAAARRRSTCAQVVEAVRAVEPVRAQGPQPRPARPRSTSGRRSGRTPAYLSIGERTNANGSKAFREAMLGGRWDDCVEIARSQIRDGAHLLDLCIDYVGRDGVADMREIAGRFATASTLPMVLDSTEPPVIEAGLEMLGGRCVVNSVNYEDGDGPESRFARVMPIVREHGAAVVALTIDEEGQARTAEWKVRVADRLIDDLVENWGMRVEDIIVDCLTFPIAHRPGGDPPRRHRDDRGDPRGQAALPGGADHARAVQRLLRAQPGRPRRCSTRCSCTSASTPASTRRSCTPSKILPMAPDPGRAARGRPRPGLRPRAARATTRCSGSWSCSRASTPASARQSRAEELAALPLSERLERRIIDGERNGLEADLDEALDDPARRWRSSTTRCWPA